MHRGDTPPPGLPNRSNACFLNAVIQSLASSPSLLLLHHHHHQQHQQQHQQQQLLEGTVGRAVWPVVEAVAVGAAPDSSELVSLGWAEFRGEQQDAHECLKWLTNQLSEEDPELPRLLGGVFLNHRACLLCQSLSALEEPFLDISLPLEPPSRPSRRRPPPLRSVEQQQRAEQLLEAVRKVVGPLADQPTGASRLRAENGGVLSSIAAFMGPEVLAGDDSVECSRCRTQRDGARSPMLRWYRIKTAPQLMILHLKRFRAYSSGKTIKIEKECKFPLRLDVAQFCLSPVESLWYRLVAVTEHQGHAQGGHYVAYVLRGQDTWFCVSDSKSWQVDRERLLNVQPYLLYYERINDE